MSLKDALQKCFEDEPDRVFGIQDLCNKVQKYYTFSNFQKQLDTRYPQPRYEHEIRSQVNKLKKEGLIIYIARDSYKLT
jgi:hypothetical protein